ncbi:hypothetical protein M3J07_013885 [Ascochyta lentis]
MALQVLHVALEVFDNVALKTLNNMAPGVLNVALGPLEKGAPRFLNEGALNVPYGVALKSFTRLRS